MRRDSSDELAAAARRRWELLGRELADAGLRPLPDPVETDLDPARPGPVLVPDPGRHSRGRPGPASWPRRVEAHLPAPLRGRLDFRATHVALMAVLLASGVVIAAWATMRAAPQAVPVPMAHTAPASSPASAPGGMPSGSTPAEVVVDVVGKVRRPGIARLPIGSRVIDAVRMAGGARAGVDLSLLNLARVLVDGEQIVVGPPRRGSGLPAGAAAGPGAGGGAGGLVSLNSAGLEQLESLPGVGPVTAQKILDWRAEHGGFGAVDELLEVDGIGAKTLADLSPHVTL